MVINNTFIRNWSSWHKVFQKDIYSGTLAGSNFYRPLQAISFMVDYSFWQLQPFGFHLTNIVLQAIVSFLVFLFILTVLKNTAIAFTAALLFSVNPLHTEVVSYISGRAELLFAVNLILAFLLFVKSENSPGRQGRAWYLGSVVFFIAGLLSKELAVVFPLVIVAWIYYYAPGNFRKPGYLFKNVIPFFVIAALYGILRNSILHFTTLWPQELTKYSLAVRLSIIPQALLTYLKILLLPVNLHMSRTLGQPTQFWEILISYIVLAVIAVGWQWLLSKNKKHKHLSFFSAWALIFLLPQSGIVPINAFVAEHFIYLPSIGFFAGVSYLLYTRLQKRIFVFSIIGLVSFYGLLTYGRNLQWRNPIVFYKHIIVFSPDSFLAHNNLGWEYEKIREYDRAVEEYKKAIALKPERLEPHSNLANAYFKMKRYKDSEEEYKIVQRIAPYYKMGEVQNNIGALYEAQGLLDKALARYGLAGRLDPALEFSHFNSARIYFVKKELDRACAEIIQSFPQNSCISASGGRCVKIIAEYLLEAKGLNFAGYFYNDLGARFARESFFEAAILAFDKVIRLAPNYSDAHFNIALVYWNMGQKDKAVQELKKVFKVNPNHLRAKALLKIIKQRL